MQEPERLREQIVAETRRRFRGYVVGVALVSLIVGGLVGFYGFEAGTPSEAPGITTPAGWGDPATASASATSGGAAALPTPQPLRVYVSGAVATPQVVLVPPGSLVVDALEAAGGARADADLEALNLAASLGDHQHVVVPAIGQEDRASASATTENGIEEQEDSAPLARQVNLNTASASELEALPHIGATRAADIVAYREAHGPFEHIEEIQNVPGIGPAIYETLAPWITVGP
jgi:competence protein ComEA